MTPGAKPSKDPPGTGRYGPLTAFLRGQDASSVTMTFDQLADILGFRLPAAASNHAEWWREASGHPQARGWRDAGWSFVRTDRRAQTVTFRRDAPAKNARGGTKTKPRAAASRPAVTRKVPAKAPDRSSGSSLACGLILIPDSAQMRSGGDPAWRRQSTALALPGDAGARLGEARRTLAELVDEAAGPDLGGDGNRRAYLPALERYTGSLYAAAETGSWSAADRETMRRCCLIVSGLYGLLTATEPIREHGVTMQTARLPDGQPVSRWWREHGLGDVLRSYVSGSGVAAVYSFLPAEHIEALGGLEFEGAEVHRIARPEEGEDLAEQGRALARLVREGA